MADYIIQKAVNIDAVNKKFQRVMEDYARSFEAQHKYDGCCAVVTLDSDDSHLCQSRTGEVYPCLDGLAEELMANLWDDIVVHGGLVLIGEAWWPGKDQFSAISGDFRRHKVSDKLMLIINDVLTFEEFDQGSSLVPYSARMERLTGALPDRAAFATRYPPGSYGDPQALCNELVDMGGFDGLILRDPNGTWTRGRGTTGEIVKIKRVLSYDLRCIGVVAGKGKHEGRLGAIQVNFGGRLLAVGTGFTDAQRDEWWSNFQSNDDGIVGRIVEVEAMDLSSEGLLREPRFKGIRFDKTEPDAIAA